MSGDVEAAKLVSTFDRILRKVSVCELFPVEVIELGDHISLRSMYSTYPPVARSSGDKGP
jgi:hypothetical protein